MRLPHFSIRHGRLALALVLTLGAAGCDTLEKLNPFEEHKKPLAGQRQPVFPEGVPGVDYKSQLDQPSNSNTSIDNLPANPPQGKPAQPAPQ